MGFTQQYFSNITPTAQIFPVFPGFHQYWTGALKCFAQGQSHENSEDPVHSEPRTPGLRIKRFTTEPRSHSQYSFYLIEERSVPKSQRVLSTYFNVSHSFDV